MNGMLRDLLNERAADVGSPDVDLHDLVARGERRVKRRRRAAVGAAAAAVALTVGATLALVQTGNPTSSPAGRPTDPPSTVKVPDTTDGSRPLTYGVGGTIHYGGRVIEAAEDADGLFVFDDGLVFLTGADGRTSETRLFFTDGASAPVEIARGIGMVTSGEVGSLLVWLDDDDVVIYDVHIRAVVARVPLNGLRLANPIIPLEDAVYWTEYDDSTATTLGDGRLVRYDLSTGNRTPATQADLQAETRPMLVVGSADSLAPADCCSVVDSRLQGYAPGGRGPAPVFVTATGERLRVRVPDRYEGETLSVFQWLDDDRFAIVMSVPGVGRVPSGDLLVCRVSADECRTVASGEHYWLLPGPGASVGRED